MSNTPHLRFPGFKGEWKEKKLGEVTIWDKFFQGVPKQLQSKVIKYPYVLANVFSDIERKEGTVLLLSTGNYVGWTTEELAGSNLCEGEVVAIPWGGTANVKYAKGKFVTADNRIATSSDPAILNNKFLYYFMLSNKNTIDGFYRGAGIKHPSMFDVLSMPILLPSISEQKKIVSLLSQLDDIIAAQGQKVDALKEKKKGLMQQLFPQPGETTPRLRFPGFEGEWVEKKLGDLYRKNNVKNDLSFGTDKIISVANMYYKTDANIGDKDYLRTYNNFRLGDIAYEGNKSANYAYGRFVENTIGDGIVSHVFDVYSPISSMHCIDYWKYAINYERIMRPILEKSTIKSTMMTNLIAKDFLKQHILVPSLTEQQKIASCLSSLDDLIAAESAKVEALKDHKKGLMQQLFPQPTK